MNEILKMSDCNFVFRNPCLRASRVDQVPALHSGRDDSLVPGGPPPWHGLRGHPLRVWLPDLARAPRLVQQRRAQPRAAVADPGMSGDWPWPQTVARGAAITPLAERSGQVKSARLPSIRLRGFHFLWDVHLVIVVVILILVFSLHGEFWTLIG